MNSHYSCSEIIVDFCRQKTTGQDAFPIPLMAVHEVCSYVTQMDNTKSSGPDGLSNQLLKQSMPYSVESLTLIAQNIFPADLKKPKDHNSLNDY